MGIKVQAPVPGSCRICAMLHDPEQPHDKDSLYYQVNFRRRYRRFPTWEDAMSHCTEAVKEEYRKKLEQNNI